MRLTDFKRTSVVLEVKYEDKFTIWDNIGAFWDEFKRVRPELKLLNANNSTTQFSLGEQTEIVAEIKRFCITWYDLPNAQQDEFANLCEDFIAVAKRVFGLEAFTRVGYRNIYFKETESLEIATQEFLELGLLKVPTERHFNIAGRTTTPEYQIGAENGTLGFTLKMQAAKTDINLNVPMNISSWIDVRSGNYKRYGILIDVDYFTVVTVSAAQLNIKEWLEQSTRAIKRDMHVYLGADHG